MKRFLPHLLVSAILAGGCGFGWHWFSTWRYIEKTDNAYIRSEITQISSKVAGYVMAVPAGDNIAVAAGDVLVRIEEDEYRIRLDNAGKKLEERQASLRVAQTRSILQQSRIDACAAQLSAAEAEQDKRGSELRRFSSIHSSGIVSEQEYEAVVAAEKRARAETANARANLESARKELLVFQAEEKRLEAELRQQREELKLPARELGDTVIRSPVAGVVGNRRVRPGQYVRPGMLLMAVIPRDDLWVEANFKEVQLGRMHEGQAVTIEVDTFPGLLLTGRVESLAPASGAEFSLIPPENATGNFTKIVQRVPVKIRFNAAQPMLRNLRPGMSVVVKLDTRPRRWTKGNGQSDLSDLSDKSSDTNPGHVIAHTR